MEGSKIFYIKYPTSEILVNVFVILGQFILVFLTGINIFVIIWINAVLLFFGYKLLKILMVNIYKQSYFLIDMEGILCVHPFNKKVKYLWGDYQGHILVDNLLLIQFGNRNVKIINSFLKNGNINEIINLIEENKVKIEYDM